jgi:O-antigen/teichoic acid export membrane protein
MDESKIATPVGLPHLGRVGFLLKDSLLYGVAAAISKAFSLITFPLLARHFSVADYGVLDYFIVLSGFLAIFFVFGQDSTVARYFYQHEATSVRRQLISQSLVFQLAGLALLFPLFWWGGEWITRFLIATPESVRLFRIVLLQLPFMLLINFSQNLLKWSFARNRFLTMSLGFTMVQASLLVLVVMVWHVEVEEVLLVSLITSVVFGLLGLFFIRQWLTFPRDFRLLREMLPFALPYGVVSVLGAFSPSMERMLTLDILGAEDLGLYAAGTKVAMLIGLMCSSFHTAWGPFSLSLYKQDDAPHTYNLVLKVFVISVCLIVFALALLAPSLIHLLATDRYADAKWVVFPLAMGLAIQAISWITEIGIGISKRSYLNLYAYSFAVTTTFAGIWLLAPVFGIFGVSIGVMFGYIVRALVASWLAQRAFPLPWDYAPVGVVISMTLILGLAATWVGYHWGAFAQNVGFGASAIAVIVVGWSVLLNASERQRLVSSLAVRLAR